MKEFLNNAFFWQKIDTLVFSSKIVITKRINDKHNEYPNLIYPVDYGYLSVEEDGRDTISVYQGKSKKIVVNAIIVAIDILKKDIEVKLLVGCDETEEALILNFLNQTDFQKTVLLRRGQEIPSWAESE